MALIKCHECGTEVSTEAKTCPKCGAKPKKPTSRVTMLIAILIGIGFVAAMSTGGGGSATQPAAETPEQKAQKEAETKRYIAAVGVSKILRDSMREPESLTYDTLRVNEDASIICAEYRARNGFGGMNREFIVVSKDGTSQKPSAWNKHCIKTMHDMMWAAK